MTDDPDSRYMRLALDLAERGWGRVAPNPLVGSVVVDGQGIAGQGWHAERGGPHAEVYALRNAGARSRSATLYVTLEPCSHYGKTPPCTDAIIASGVRRVVFAAADPNPRARGGADVLRAAGIEVQGGVEEQHARDQNAVFFHRFASTARPWIALKLALSLDAAVADANGRSQWITGEAARAETHRLRAGFDAIGVGIGTALADDPLLMVRGAVRPRTDPVRVIWDHHLRLPLGSALVRSARDVPVWVVCATEHSSERREALEQAGVRVLPAQDTMDGLVCLRDEGVSSLLCEGGRGMTAGLLTTGSVDRLYLFYAPLVLGATAQRAFSGVPSAALSEAGRWRNLGAIRFGNDTLLTLAG